MYNKYFHFTEQPFSIAPDPHFMYMSARHQEGLAHLLYGITRGGGFVALTGEVGTGKTTLCHCLLQQLPSDIDLALILNPKLNASELLAAICDELGVIYDKNASTLKNLIDLLNQHLLAVHASGRRTVLLIDEAQNLSLEVLEQIRLLTNLETSKTKLLQIILVGQPELKQLLKRQDLRQLNQRITARYHLLPLSFEETSAYIHHRLTVSNGDPDLFKPGAIRKIYKLSSGIPRVINILCDRALLGAYSTNARVIRPNIIKHAAKELLAETDNGAPRIATLLSLILLCCIVAAIYIVGYHPPVVKDKKIQAAKVIKPITKPEPAIVAQQTEQKIQPPLEKIPSKPKVDFNTWINDPGLTLNAALQQTLKIWGNAPPASHSTDCNDVQAAGLNCLFGKASWKEVLAMNRPIILEFLLTAEEKRYAVLTGIRQSQSIVQLQGDMPFPLADVLKFWNGYYLLLWKSPRPDMKKIYPAQRSDNVLWLRQQLNVVNGIQETANNPQFFDKALKKRVIDFQHQNNLLEDGIAGAQTIIYLDNISGSADSPHLKITD
ncbi:MAG: AAA family ATPase [Gammaproteobacteria bacterium]